MNQPRGRLVAKLAGFALILLLALPTAAAAADFGAPPATGPVTATLPLLGSALTVDVTLDESGHLASVALDPITTDPGGDFTATVLRPHAVNFENADGTVNVTISAWGGNTSLRARAGSLGALEGTGTWKADLFDTGTKTTVEYTVGHDGSGAPTLAIGSVNAPGAIDVTIGTPQTKTGDHGAAAWVKIGFAWKGYTKQLRIGVSTHTKGDETSARLQVTLSGRGVQKLQGALADVLGSHTWNGKLCDGTAISVAFQVVDDGAGNGKVTYDPDTFASGAAAHARDFKKGNGFVAVFDGKRAAVMVWLRKADDGTWTLAVGSFAGRWCEGTTVADPAVNTPVSPDATKGGDGKWHWRFWGGGGHHDHGWIGWGGSDFGRHGGGLHGGGGHEGGARV